MPSKVKCIQSDGDDGFTIGKVYNVLEKGLGDVLVVDDEGNQSYLLDDEYEIIEA
jgi:ribosomal 30S subunit maturation factor RimM